MNNHAIVGFVYTQACPLKCNFCCHTPEIVGEGKFSQGSLVRIIRDFAKNPSVIRFAFTGGDPFLYINQIAAIIFESRREGVVQPFHLVTSGYWAKTDGDTLALLSKLRDLGVDLLCLSYDTEHGRFVSPETVMRIARCCKAVGVRLEIFGVFWSQEQKVEDLLPAFDNVRMHSSLVFPIGEARTKFNGTRYKLDDSAKYSCGRSRVYDVAIYPDGDAYPCCSGGFNREGKLECGNVFRDNAETILEKVFCHFTARVAKEIGFDKLYAKLRVKLPSVYEELTKFSEVDSVCQICRNLHGNSALMDRIAPIMEEMEVEYALETLDKDWDTIDSR